MKELLQTGLLIGGWSLVALSIASFWIPKALGWREKLAGLTPLMRDLWWTYSIYVWSSHVFFALMALGDRVKGGQVLGSWPIRADDDLNVNTPGPGGLHLALQR